VSQLLPSLGRVDPAELRQQAIELEADLWPDHAEDRRGVFAHPACPPLAARLVSAFDRVFVAGCVPSGPVA